MVELAEGWRVCADGRELLADADKFVIVRSGSFELATNLYSQLQILAFPAGPSIDVLDKYVTTAVQPIVSSFGRSTASENAEAAAEKFDQAIDDGLDKLMTVLKKRTKKSAAVIPDLSALFDALVQDPVVKNALSEQTPTKRDISAKEYAGARNLAQHFQAALTRIQADLPAYESIDELDKYCARKSAILTGFSEKRDLLARLQNALPGLLSNKVLGFSGKAPELERLLRDTSEITRLLGTLDMRGISEAATLDAAIEIFGESLARFLKSDLSQRSEGALIFHTAEREFIDRFATLFGKAWLSPSVSIDDLMTNIGKLKMSRSFQKEHIRTIIEMSEKVRSHLSSKGYLRPSEHTTLSAFSVVLAQLVQTRKNLSQYSACLNFLCSTLKDRAKDQKQAIALAQRVADELKQFVIKAVSNLKEAKAVDVSESTELEKEGGNLLASLIEQRQDRSDTFRILEAFKPLMERQIFRQAIASQRNALSKDISEELDELIKIAESPPADRSVFARLYRARLAPNVMPLETWALCLRKEVDAIDHRVQLVCDKQASDQYGLLPKLSKLRNLIDIACLEVKRWKQSVDTLSITSPGHLLSVSERRTNNVRRHELAVGVFGDETIRLLRECHLMKSIAQLDSKVLANMKTGFDYLLPARILQQSVKRYSIVVASIEKSPSLRLLMVEQVANCRGVLRANATEALSIKSDASASSVVDVIKEAVDSLYGTYETLSAHMSALNEQAAELSSCPFAAKDFSGIITKLQRVAATVLTQKSLSNTSAWLDRVDAQIEAALARRLVSFVRALQLRIVGDDAKSPRSDPLTSSVASPSSPAATADESLVESFKFSLALKLSNGEILPRPSVDETRAAVLGRLQSISGAVVGLETLRSKLDTQKRGPVSSSRFGQRVFRHPELEEVMEHLLGDLENLLRTTRQQLLSWQRYQLLWDVDVANIVHSLGSNVRNWQVFLKDMGDSRVSLDNKLSKWQYGCIELDSEKVQSDISLRIESLQRELVSRFAVVLGERMENAYKWAASARKLLESFVSTDTLAGSSNTGAAVEVVLAKDRLTRERAAWDDHLDGFTEGQALLERLHFKLPREWVNEGVVLGEFKSVDAILQRLREATSKAIPELQKRVTDEENKCLGATEQLIADWQQNRPVGGEVQPQFALNQLKVFEGSMTGLREEAKRIEEAKRALGLEVYRESRISDALEELAALREAWSEALRFYSELEKLGETLWAAVQVRKTRQALEELVKAVKAVDPRLRQYGAFGSLDARLRDLLKMNGLLTDLKSEALKDRHWRRVFRILEVQWDLQNATLAHFWQAKLVEREKALRDVLVAAQGELALETYILSVKDWAQNLSLSLVAYQNKCRLIRGWDDLFNKLREHVSSFAAMRLSPYYKVFEEEAAAMEERLMRALTLFDSWVDVQRRWVYLDGIFSGSDDLRVLLPAETARFTSISNEYLGIMRRVDMQPRLLEVISISNVDRSLTRLTDLLKEVQKALGEYLERQRASLARFYFIGDEDLLDMIGNGSDVTKLQRHFRKMYAGIHTLVLDRLPVGGSMQSPVKSVAGGEKAASSQQPEQGADHQSAPSSLEWIVGICSREGELVTLNRSVSIKQHPRIHEWMGAMELALRETLGSVLVTALKEAERSSTMSGALAMLYLPEWLDTLPTQVMLLAVQALWTWHMEQALESPDGHADGANKAQKRVTQVLEAVRRSLESLAASGVSAVSTLSRKRIEQLITMLVHMRDCTRQLLEGGARVCDFEWTSKLRVYVPGALHGHRSFATTADTSSNNNNNNNTETVLLSTATIEMVSAKFAYGFEYLGLADRLVQTPLTDRCYLTLTQALQERLGGCPFGPAGTGKTETVKALGNQLGVFTLVFNCDDTFDFKSMGRIFSGLCEVGAWGCFDEFNRLEEGILSAVSQQIQTIQLELRRMLKGNDASRGTPGRADSGSGAPGTHLGEVELLGKSVKVHPRMGIFVTMNPGYAGRSQLPDNLKRLFRPIAMTSPDRQMIAEVMLYSQGFQSAEVLARRVVPFFRLCAEQMSQQSHYDFGLRALKSVLVSAGSIKRIALAQRHEIQPVTEPVETGSPEDFGNDATPVEPQQQQQQQHVADGKVVDMVSLEQSMLIRAVTETMFPKLVAADVPVMKTLLQSLFPQSELLGNEELARLREEIVAVCRERLLVPTEELVTKILQLYLIQRIHHGVMLVGPAGSGKTNMWEVLLEAMSRVEQCECMSYVIDPKALDKDELYGQLDPNTREWTDGVFTAILRKIVDNVRDEAIGHHWIVFDGDVDPEWVENLNSVLDDNKLLTLPNGERISLPPNVRIMFEVADLKYATLATVSRCGMVWISEGIVTPAMLLQAYLNRLQTLLIAESSGMGGSSGFAIGGDANGGGGGAGGGGSDGHTVESASLRRGVRRFTPRRVSVQPAKEGSDTAATPVRRTGGQGGGGGGIGSPQANAASPALSTPRAVGQSSGTMSVAGGNDRWDRQQLCRQALAPLLSPGGMVLAALERALNAGQQHVMELTAARAISVFVSLLEGSVRVAVYGDANEPGMPMVDRGRVEAFITYRAVLATLWAFAGDARQGFREQLSVFVRSVVTFPVPEASLAPSLLDFQVNVQAQWVLWRSRVVPLELQTQDVVSGEKIVPTSDTLRHEELLLRFLIEKRPMVLCGPPGSGKTMTLMCALRHMPHAVMAALNFSSATSPELVLQTLEQHCGYTRTATGWALAPKQADQWLVLFCDEVNLPDMDRYGTQRVISFLRQLVEQQGFWHPRERYWVSVERVLIVGACNPPTDPGRKPISARLLRHMPVVMVDYPVRESLVQIYGAFVRAALRTHSSLKGMGGAVTEAMVEMYGRSQEHFTVDMQPHYVYSPRELTRWTRGLYDALQSGSMDQSSSGLRPTELLVRVWAHEAQRLFRDRLVDADEREWVNGAISSVARQTFQGVDLDRALAEPILFSNWLNKDYVPVDREVLRDYAKARLRVFYEEELDVPLVLFDDVLDHVLRIDRVLRQVQGHALLVGTSGSGKTTLSRFVAWMNGMGVFQLKVHRGYTAENFDDDLRQCLVRAGCKSERLVFIMDESNILEASFLERMNTLLANGEIPGLFEGEQWKKLMEQCRASANHAGVTADTPDELYQWFKLQVMRNLHVVFTMNPSASGLKDRAKTSPALFNRCVVNWMGDWSVGALLEVSSEFLRSCDIEEGSLVGGARNVSFGCDLRSVENAHEAVSTACAMIHDGMRTFAGQLAGQSLPSTHVTPRHFVDFVNQFKDMYAQKREELEEQQRHLRSGLKKISETVVDVERMQAELGAKRKELDEKTAAANAKLSQMLVDQKQAEDKREASVQLQAVLEEQNRRIAEKRSVVLADLSQVEPMIESARTAVTAIKKQQLAELRTMGNPPVLVKSALEVVCIILGETNLDWKAVRSVVVRDDFISNVVNFDTQKITPSMQEAVQRYFKSQPDFTEEAVNRSSRACGPLLTWALAQLNYAGVLEKVGPLRAELQTLEQAAGEARVKCEEAEQMVAELERSIVGYKAEYAELIAQAEQLKHAMSTVQTRVSRSRAVLASLSGEQERWDAEQGLFASQMQELAGNVLLCSAFVAYAGFFDQPVRSTLFKRWQDGLELVGLDFTHGASVVEMLATTDQQLQWQEEGLGGDDLSLENGVLLHRFRRFPLVIDPSEEKLAFLMKRFRDRKISQTSVLNSAFRKHLENALRFGTMLLIQDVEAYDPILNPVLNREIQRVAGRALVRIGDQDIDFSRDFSCVLFTKDAGFEAGPDLCSRVTLVNFSMTSAALQDQCLHHVMKHDRPDIEERRLAQIKLQGEFRLRLRRLEKDLLNTLSSTQGGILEDDTVLASLERVQSEAADILRKAKETAQVIAEIEHTSKLYRPFARACSAVFFTLEQLSHVHFLYRYSLSHFHGVFDAVLAGSGARAEGEVQLGMVDATRRVKELVKHLFLEMYRRTEVSLLYKDRTMLAVHCATLMAESGVFDEEDGGRSAARLLGLLTHESMTETMHHGQVDKWDLLSKAEPVFGRVERDVVVQMERGGSQACEVVARQIGASWFSQMVSDDSLTREHDDSNTRRP
jgi:dynein heavy chain 1, cytosolic